MSHYEDVNGFKIGYTKAEAIAFLSDHPNSDIYYHDDDGHEIEVTRDIRDVIVAAEEATLSEMDVLRGSLIMLQKQIVRLSNRVDALEAKMDRLMPDKSHDI